MDGRSHAEASREGIGANVRAALAGLRILFSTPAYWPASAFGGPVGVLRALAGGLVAGGDDVDVLSTSLVDLTHGRSVGTRQVELDGAHVRYLATPFRFRWMGVTPSLPAVLGGLPRPDIVHVFGFRDPLGTGVAWWCRRRGIPYVLEPLGMFRPKLRKVPLKRALDATVLAPVVRGATLLVATSEVERAELVGAGVDPGRIAVRPNGFPVPSTPTRGVLRARLGLDERTPLVLYVGRIARGKGIELLVRSLNEIAGAHLAIVGPDDRHGLLPELVRESRALGLEDRVHLLGAAPPTELPSYYADADVFVLASRHENFGMVAAEAAAAGVPSVVTDRCGIADLLRDRAGLVVPYDAGAVREAIVRLLGDEELRTRLAAGAHAVAAEWSWPKIVERQRTLYADALERA